MSVAYLKEVKDGTSSGLEEIEEFVDIHLLVYCCDMRSRVNEIGYLVKFSIQIVLPKLIRARM